MSLHRSLCGTAFCGFLAAIPATASADVQCWAPGMPSTVSITSTARNQAVNLGKPYRYDIFGVGGTLTLGDQANQAQVTGGVFKQKLLGLIPLGGTVSSTAFIELQTGLTNFYPQTLSVSGTTPGTTVGPVQQYGADWTLCDPKHQVPVNLTFHTAGSNLLTALLPGLLSPSYYNINPTGYFYVLGEYHAAPPVMSGTLSVPADSVMVGTQSTVSFYVEKDDQPIYRPPFLGLDLGSTNLTLLGSPPANSPASAGVANAPVYATNTSQALVSVNLTSGNAGDGWARVKLNL
jgi:hypothetical protein